MSFPNRNPQYLSHSASQRDMSFHHKSERTNIGTRYNSEMKIQDNKQSSSYEQGKSPMSYINPFTMRCSTLPNANERSKHSDDNYLQNLRRQGREDHTERGQINQEYSQTERFSGVSYQGNNRFGHSVSTDRIIQSNSFGSSNQNNQNDNSHGAQPQNVNQRRRNFSQSNRNDHYNFHNSHSMNNQTDRSSTHRVPNLVDINQVGEEKNGVYIVDEMGVSFIQEEIEGNRVKERIFLDENHKNKAVHLSVVKFCLVAQQKQNHYNKHKFQTKRAQITQVIQYPCNISNLIGFFGELNRTAEKPEIDFDIHEKEISYQNKEEFYFYPLDFKYPRMVLKLKNAESLYPNGELFKRYFKVKFLEWPDELLNLGPLVEIIGPQGYLYDENSDYQALLSSLSIHTDLPQDEEKSVKQSIQNYSDIITSSSSQYFPYLNPKIFTVDQMGTVGFDDALSIERITYRNLLKEHQPLENSRKTPELDDETEIENLLDQMQLSEKQGYSYFKIGIHISDFSLSIEKGTPLYRGLEQRGQSIYLNLGDNKNFVNHMLDRSLIDQFAMKRGELRLAKSLFFCAKLDNSGEISIDRDSFSVQNTKVSVQENYFYNEFDHLCNAKQDFMSLFKMDHYPNSKDEWMNQTKQKDLLISNEEAQVLFKVGALLFQGREEKGSKIFKDDSQAQNQRYVSSILIEEFMVLYNQYISREILAKEYVNKHEKDISKILKDFQMKADYNLKQLQSDKKVVQKNLESLEAQNEQTRKSVNLLQSQIDSQTIVSDKEQIFSQTDQDLMLEEENLHLEWTYQPKDQASLQSENEYEILMALNSSNQQKNKSKLYDTDEDTKKLPSLSNLKKVDFINEKASIKEETNPYTAKKNNLIKQSQQDLLLKQRLQNEINQRQAENPIIDNTRVKESHLKQIIFFEKQCQDVGFYNFKYSTQSEFQSSIKQLQNFDNVNPIIKKYLLFTKDRIQKDLNYYFTVCQREETQIQENNLFIQQKKNKINQLEKDLFSTYEAIDRLTLQETQHQAKVKQAMANLPLHTIKENRESSSSQCSEIKNADKKNSQLNKCDFNGLFNQSIYQVEGNTLENYYYSQKENKQSGLIEKLERNREIQQQNLSNQDIVITQLKQQISDFDRQIKCIQKECHNQETIIRRKFEQEAKEIYRLLDIFPESERYLSATSPIRKFNDLIVQQFLNSDQISLQNFQKEYGFLLQQKQRTTSLRNQIRKFREMGEKLKVCRNILLKMQKEGQSFQKKEYVLQINLKRYAEFQINFFLPDEMQIVKFIAKEDQPIPKNFTIWGGTVAPQKSLPYGIELLSITTQTGEFHQPITLTKK